jgi:DUF1365 family protein
MAPGTASVYEGTISHRRRAVRDTAFRHRIALAYLDVDALPAALTRRRPGVIRFRRADYLGDPAIPLADAVRDLVRLRTGHRPHGPVRVLTHLRVLGRCFNPVSFYYCFDAHEQLRAVVAEVTNTPWGERHAYVLEAAAKPSAEEAEARTPKELHVSPFFGMAQEYAWTTGRPGKSLAVHIANDEQGETVFDAHLALHRRPFTRAWRARHALSALRVGVLIYAHAAALKLRGVPVHRHPAQAR